MRRDLIPFSGEIAQRAVSADAVVEERGHALDAGLLGVGEVGGDSEGEGEDAAVEVRHGGAEEGESPVEGVGFAVVVADGEEADFHAGAGVLRVVPFPGELLELEGELDGELGFVCDGLGAGLDPALLLGV